MSDEKKNPNRALASAHNWEFYDKYLFILTIEADLDNIQINQ